MYLLDVIKSYIKTSVIFPINTISDIAHENETQSLGVTSMQPSVARLYFLLTKY